MCIVFRNHKTTNEVRARLALEADAHDSDFTGMKIRARRTAHTIPNAYDDIDRGHRGRNWKNFRRTKWRA